MAVPVVAGTVLGLDAAGIASFTQRTFFFSGLASLIQAIWGHRYPIFEGPAGVWYSATVSLAVVFSQQGKPPENFRAALEAGLLAAGVLLILICVTRLSLPLRKLFSPVVTGTFLILLSLQVNYSIVKGFITACAVDHTYMEREVAVFLITLAATLSLFFKSRGFVQSIAPLAGTAIGWLAACFLAPGKATVISKGAGGSLLEITGIFPWGYPVYDAGMITCAVLAAMAIVINLTASVSGMKALMEREEKAGAYNRAIFCNGLAHIFAGIGGVIGFVPYASSIGFAALTGVYSMEPFIAGNLMLMLLGILQPVGWFFARMPVGVGYAVMFSVYVVILGTGIHECTKSGFRKREMVITGTSVMIGNALSYVPESLVKSAPLPGSFLLQNGLMAGVLLSLFLDRLLPKENGKNGEKHS